MSTPAQVGDLEITQALEARLIELLGADAVHVAEISQPLPVLTTDGQPDPSGRVAPYAVLWPGVALPDVSPSMASRATASTHNTWAGQITFAAGYALDLLAVVGDVVPQLQRWRPSIAGLDCSPLRWQPGYRPGPIRRDADVTPSRHYTPTLWQLQYVRR